MNKNKISFKKEVMISIKKCISTIVLYFLYRGFKVLYKVDSRIKEDLNTLVDGFVLELKTAKKGPKLLIRKDGDDIIKLADSEKIDISIVFKSIDAAFLVLTGQIGVARAYAEHRFTLKGDIAEAMVVVRCVDLVESYLFPKIMTKRILKTVPKREISMFTAYRKILLNF